MRRIFWIHHILFVLIASICLLGCNKKLKEPHLHDPIYKDISKMLKKAESSLAKEVKNRETLENDLEKSVARTRERTVAERDLKISRGKIKKLTQTIRYLEIRKERRALFAKKSYEKAYQAGKSWPDPKEFEHYSVNKRLQQAPRQWSKRVPKLRDRIHSQSKPVAKEKKAKSH